MPVTAHPASQRSIDPKSLPAAVRAMRLGLGALRLVSRRAAASVVGSLFVRPRRHPVPEREREAAGRAERVRIRHKDKTIQAYVWEPERAADGAPTALLVHGWEGRGTQLWAFVEPLLARGVRVVAFDHVGHGESDGKACSLPTMRDTLRSVGRSELFGGGAFEPAFIIAHSMGTFAASLLLAETWRDARVVYLAPPDDLLVYFGRYVEIVTGSQDLLPDLIRRMEERFGERVEEFEFRRLVETLRQPLLVVHSRDDLDVPIEGGRFVHEHWPGSRMVEVDGLGHRRICRDPGVVAEALEFLVPPDQ